MVKCLRSYIDRTFNSTFVLLDMLQTEAEMKLAQSTLSETQSKLKTTQESSTQLSDDNEQLREKIIQLLRY